MKIYNTIDGTSEEVPNENAWQVIFDNHSERYPKGNLLFTFEEVPNCEMKYRKIALSEIEDDQFGKWAQYGVGTISEMTEAEKEALDFIPPVDPHSESLRKLQQDKHFCLGLYDEFLLGNRANPDLTAEQVIEQANDSLVTKVLVDSGAVVSLRVVLENSNTLTAEQKTYFLNKIDQYLAG